MNLFSIVVIAIGLLMALSCISFGFYTQDWLIFAIGLLLILFALLFALETKHIMSNPFRK